MTTERIERCYKPTRLFRRCELLVRQRALLVVVHARAEQTALVKQYSMVLERTRNNKQSKQSMRCAPFARRRL